MIIRGFAARRIALYDRLQVRRTEHRRFTIVCCLMRVDRSVAVEIQGANTDADLPGSLISARESCLE